MIILSHVLQSTINKATDQIDNKLGLKDDDGDAVSTTESENRTQLDELQSQPESDKPNGSKS